MCDMSTTKSSLGGNTYDCGITAGGGTDVSKQFNHKKIMFYVISDDIYFKIGVAKCLRDIFTSSHSSNGVRVDFLKTYGVNQISSLQSDFILNKEFINTNIIIVDKDIVNLISFIFSYKRLNQAFFVASDDITQINLKKIIESKKVLTVNNSIIPCFFLFGTLNQREKRICQYLYKGYSPKFIGLLLGIHPKTVSTYKTNIMKKIGCRNKSVFNKALIDFYRYCMVDLK